MLTFMLICPDDDRKEEPRNCAAVAGAKSANKWYCTFAYVSRRTLPTTDQLCARSSRAMRSIVRRQALFVVALVASASAFFIVPSALYPMARAHATLADTLFDNGTALASFRDVYDQPHVLLVDATRANMRDRSEPILVVYDEVSPSWASTRTDAVSPRIAAQRRLLSGVLLLVAVAALVGSLSPAALTAHDHWA